MRKILLPIDGSDCSQVSAGWAADTFPGEETTFFILYVIEMNEGVRINLSGYEDAAKLMLAKTEECLKSRGAAIAKVEYVIGDPTDEICRYAEKEDVDLVVIGSHGRTGLKKFVMGSVSEGVLEHCKKPVVVYKNITGNN